MKERLWPATLLKKRSGTGVFLWILRNFSEHLFGKWIKYKERQNIKKYKE